MDKLKWTTVEYTIKELNLGNMVVTQRDILERWKTDNPGQEVRAHAGFKCNQQDRTVSIRVAVVDNTVAEGTVAKIEDKVPNPITNPITDLPIDPSKLKLLQPGYDELKAKHDELQETHKSFLYKYDELKKKYEKVKREEDAVQRLFANVQDELDVLKKKYNDLTFTNRHLIDEMAETERQILAIQEKYDALVAAVDPERDGAAAADENEKPFNAVDFQDVDLSPIDKAAIELGEDALQISPIEDKLLGQNSAGEYSGPRGSELV